MTASLHLHNIVSGRPAGTVGGEVLPLVDPSTGAEYGSAPLTRWPDLDPVLHVAAEAFAQWSVVTPGYRQRVLLRWADAVERRSDELAAVECRNTGKPWRVVRGEEIPAAVDLLRFYAGAARFLEDAAGGEYVTGRTSFARREPIGVCAQVVSWTHPLLLAVGQVAPALAAGNAVVLKPGETTPDAAVRLAEIAAEELPEGLFNVICGDRDTGRALVAHEGPGMVSITGTVLSGMEVAGAAASDLKRAHLQLGGKAPAVVFDDADVHAVARGIAEAAFADAGQSCTAASRVLAGPGVYERLLEELSGWARWMRPGGPQDPDAAFGPLNSEGQRELVERHLGRLPEHARVVAGGRRVGEHGFFLEATVVADVTSEDDLVRNEVLGPVVTVQRFADEAEAVRMANGVRYGLVASVWTRDHARAMRMSRALQAGTVWINAHRPLVAEMPHSGFKHSASGRDFGRGGVEEYTRIKHVMSAWDDVRG